MGEAKMKEIGAALREPFTEKEVKQRVGRAFGDGRSGILFLYVDARACQDRLDEVFGVDGWKTAYRMETTKEGSVVFCNLTVDIGGKTVVREDCSEVTELSDAKGAASTAFKRACAALGIGRYLYSVGEIKVRLDGKYFHGKVKLPDEYLPASEQCGRKTIEIEYERTVEGGGDRNAPRGDTEYPSELREAMEYVSQTEGYTKGKKLKEVSVKQLGWLYYNGVDKKEREYASKVRKYLLDHDARKEEPANVEQEEVDIPF